MPSLPALLSFPKSLDDLKLLESLPLAKWGEPVESHKSFVGCDKTGFVTKRFQDRLHVFPWGRRKLTGDPYMAPTPFDEAQLADATQISVATKRN